MSLHLVTNTAALGTNCRDLGKDLSSILSRYFVPAEIVFNDWYMASMAHALSANLMTRSNILRVCVLTGSRADALAVPDRCSFITGSFKVAQPDQDFMFPIRNRCKLSNQELCHLVELEPVAADPRYFKLVPHAHLKDMLRCRHPSFTGDYLPCRFFPISAEKIEGNKEVFIHGPAVRIARSLIKAIATEQDLVDSIMLDEWPRSIADAWLSRQRVSGWPGIELVRSIASMPCFLTPIGRQGSDEEWRLSFSLPERRLALAVSAAQRTVYVLVKLLMKECSGLHKTFRTYYLKNLFFWLCESQKADVWQDANLGNCLHAFLDLIESCTLSRRLPSYFVPESNLINHESEENLREVLGQVRLLRSDLVRSMTNVARNGFFMSVGAMDYEMVWANINGLSRCPSNGDDNLSNQEKLYLSLIEANCKLLRKVVTPSEQLTDAGIEHLLSVVQSLIKSIIGRQMVELYVAKYRSVKPSTTGTYCMSRELRALTNFFRSTLERLHVDVDDRLLLVGRAFLKLRLRGKSELSSGSFLPVTERQLLHMTVECMKLLPSIYTATMLLSQS